MTEKDALALVKASMIMLNTYLDLMGSAMLMESAAELVGKKKVEELILELVDADSMSRTEIKQAKAELVLSYMRGTNSIRERN